MHRTKFAEYDVLEELDLAEQAMMDKLVLGSQRVLQFGGKPILDKNARLYNCVTSFADRSKFFQEAMYLLLCGCGVGFSVQTHHINKLPKVSRPETPDLYSIPDSIEGWSDAVGVMVSSYFQTKQPFPEYKGKRVAFDYSN
jgi:ribonucleoside-diphosphate reductase alpha chain